MRQDGEPVVISMQALELCHRALIADKDDIGAMSLQSFIIAWGMRTVMLVLPHDLYVMYEALVIKHSVLFLHDENGEPIGWGTYMPQLIVVQSA
jgi:hypothetical protein